MAVAARTWRQVPVMLLHIGYTVFNEHRFAARLGSFCFHIMWLDLSLHRSDERRLFPSQVVF